LQLPLTNQNPPALNSNDFFQTKRQNYLHRDTPCRMSDSFAFLVSLLPFAGDF